MTLYFVTGNQGKFAEVQSLIPEVKQVDFDLDEIQELDPQKVIEHKLQQAATHQKGEFIVEDTSLYSESLGGLPGPFIKWFLKALGPAGTATLILSSGGSKVVAKTMIGYINTQGECHFFSGELKGEIVVPRGSRGFGWDSIFQPHGETRTFAEMTLDEKQAMSMRREAIVKLQAFLTQQ
jgi:inosine triphosphate pyrophosphatase